MYVLISPRTYSSAVLFTTVMQDYGFATLAGIGGGARSTQSGGIQNIKLPNTQMTMVVPRFVLDRTPGARACCSPTCWSWTIRSGRWRRWKLSCATHKDSELRTAERASHRVPRHSSTVRGITSTGAPVIVPRSHSPRLH